MRACLGMVVTAVGIGVVSDAGAARPVTYDCRAASEKVAGLGDICALFGRNLTSAFSGHRVQYLDDANAADIVLVVQTANDRNFAARIDWHGREKGEVFGVARRDGDLDDAARSDLINTLLQSTPR